MYRNVVVPIDPHNETEDAIAPAAVLARQMAARLQLLSVVAPGDDPIKPRTRLVELAEHHAVDADIRVLHADAVAPALVDVARRPDSLLCMQTHARRAIGELVLGSVSESVVRDAHRPVLLVGPDCGPPPERFESLVAGVDGSPPAETILPTVVDWSADLGLAPWLIQVLPPTPAIYQGVGDVTETAYARRLADRLAEQGVRSEWNVIRSRHAASAIARFAAGRPAALVALTTHGRSGISRLALGGVALAVTRRATVPVLVVHPTETPTRPS